MLQKMQQPYLQGSNKILEATHSSTVRGSPGCNLAVVTCQEVSRSFGDARYFLLLSDFRNLMTQFSLSIQTSTTERETACFTNVCECGRDSNNRMIDLFSLRKSYSVGRVLHFLSYLKGRFMRRKENFYATQATIARNLTQRSYILCARKIV